MSRPLRGAFAPICTPFTADGALDLDGLRRNLTAYAASPLAGIVVLGSNGEAPLLDEDEADAIVETARALVPSRQWLIAGTARESTRATIEATRRAAAQGVDAVMVRTPSFYKNRMDAETLVAHYTAVADASPVPVILYNITLFTGVNLTMDAVFRLAPHPNVIGLKDSGGDVALIAQLVAGAPPGFAILGGSAAAFHPSLVVGAAGGVLGVADFAPDLCAEMIALVERNDQDGARALQERLVPVARSIGPRWGIPGLKVAVACAGYAAGPPRPPLLPVPPAGVAEIRAQVEALTGVGSQK